MSCNSVKKVEYKTCAVCGKKKRLSKRNFFQQKGSVDGFQGQCKVCAGDYQKRYYYIQKERLLYYTDTIIDLAYNQELSEHEIGKLLDLPPSKVWGVIVKERSRRKRGTSK